MIERLIAGLRGAGLEPTAREIADALWLADQMQRAVIVEQPPGGQSISPPPISPPTPPFKADLPQERTGSGAAPEPRTGVYAHLGSAFKAAGLPFRSPTATALPGRLALGRALRPFKRRVPSRIQAELDEYATAERIARGLRPAAVVRPAPTRWLELSLVIDAGASMSIWRQSVAELRSLLVQCGAFRDVRVYQFVSDEEGPVTLFAGMPGTPHGPVGERELCDPSGRRLVLIVSDCVAPAWSDGRVGALVREWGRRGPTAILQVLPERLWDRTGLSDAPRVRLKAPSRGVRNTELQVESHPWTLIKDTAIALPIVELEAPRVAAWAAMLVGNTAVAVSGVMLSATADPNESAFADLEAEESTADERIARFLSMATAGARRLAVLFAAAPLALPVMRIIRETMAPETTLGHLAEVFLGGLLREAHDSKADNAPTASEHRAYDFWPGVRERLLDSANAGDATRVLEEASAYLTEHMGSTVDFRALLADPAAARTGPIEARDRPFATIGTEVLRRLGGEYKRLAEGLNSTLARAADSSTSRRGELAVAAQPHVVERVGVPGAVVALDNSVVRDVVPPVVVAVDDSVAVIGEIVHRPALPAAAATGTGTRIGRRALLVGAGQKLRGVEHDIRSMAAMLSSRGFEVDARTGSEATRQGILDGYGALIARVQEGDAAVFYYSGHSFRVFVESESSAWQGISPVDISDSTDDDFRGITAWELSILEAQLTQRTRNVTVILDCSYAAQMSRGRAIREAEDLATAADATSRTLPHPVRRGFAAHLRALRSRYGSAFDAVDPTGNRDTVRLVACGPNHAAYESVSADGMYHGVFTAALLDVLNEVGDAPVSWAALEGAIRGRVQRKFAVQRPDIEGPARRRLFSLEEDDLGGAVTIVPMADGFRLGAGRLMGVVDGDVYAVMPSGLPTYRPAEAIADVRVRRPFATYAEAELVRWRNGHTALPDNAIAFIADKVTARWPVRVIVPNHAHLAVMAEIAATRYLRVTAIDEPTTLATLRLADDQLTVEDDLGPLFSGARYPEHLRPTVRNLANLAVAQQLRELEGEHGVHAGELLIEWGTVYRGLMQPLPTHGSELTLRDKVYVRVRSRTPKPLHAHVLSLGLRGKITLLTAFAPSGVALTAEEPEFVLGRRSDGALIGLAFSWPLGMPRVSPRIDELVVIITSKPASLRSLETEIETTFISRNIGAPQDLDGFFVMRLSCLLDPRDAAAEDVALRFEVDDLARPDAKPPTISDARDDQDLPVTNGVPGTDRDFGVVIGIEHYPYFRSLPGAANDATRFCDWLCDMHGGGLARSHVSLILSDLEMRTPSQDDVDETLLALLQAAEARGGGRRLYFYFSGHGGNGESQDDIALLLTRWSQIRVRLALSTGLYARALCETGLFEEIVMFIDCCRDLSMAAIGMSPTFTRVWKTEPRPTRMFRAYATDVGLRAYESGDTEPSQGLFTRCLLSILRQSSGISAAVLRERLFERVASEASRHGLQQRPYVENDLAETSRFGVGRKHLRGGGDA